LEVAAAALTLVACAESALPWDFLRHRARAAAAAAVVAAAADAALLALVVAVAVATEQGMGRGQRALLAQSGSCWHLPERCTHAVPLV